MILTATERELRTITKYYKKDEWMTVKLLNP